METVLLVDGQNFKKNAEKILEEEGILDAKEVLKEGRAYKKMERPDWCLFDFEGLLNQVLEGLEVNSKFFYLSKIISYPQTKEKSEQLIKEQRLLLTHLKRQGFQPLLAGNVRGYFEERDGKIHATFREKGVDVRIAVDMIKIALLEKLANTIILVSSDSDLHPLLEKFVKEEKPT